MDELSGLLSGLSAEDVSKLKAAANSLLSGSVAEKPTKNVVTVPSTTGASANALDHMPELLQIFQKGMTKQNNMTQFLESLMPLLSAPRQEKTKEAIRFIQLMDILPLWKGLL